MTNIWSNWKKTVFSLLFCVATSGASAEALATSESSSSQLPPLDRRNALSLEWAGRSGQVTVNFDRLFEPYFAWGIGVSSFAVTGPESPNRTQVIMVPVYANLYQSWHHNRGFVTVGTNLSNSDRRPPSFGFISTPNSGAYLTLGLGYEYRGNGPLLCRVSLYTLSSRLEPWLGAALGYSF